MKGLMMLGVISLVLVRMTALSWAEKPLYVSGKIGANFQSNTQLGGANVSPDPGISLLGAVGADFEKPFRLEGELGLFHNTYDAHNPFTGARFTGEYNLANFMVNGYWDWMRDKPVHPYIGFGGGLSLIRVEIDVLGGSVGDTTVVAAAQGILGVEYTLAPRIALLTEYRYLTTSDPTVRFSGIPVNTEYDAHHFLIGVRLFSRGKQSGPRERGVNQPN